VLLEALSCGTPVVSTFAGGIPEVISNGQNGILVPANNHQELAKAIQNLLDNKNVRARFGRAGRDWVLGNFSIKASAKKLSNIYADIVAKSHN
jgi:glycosyltransferase involved in cell wall biosynthesis